MIKTSLKKMVTIGLVAVSLLMANSIGVSASWKKDSHGWWQSNSNGYVTGWYKEGSNWYYLDKSGYMKTGWLQESNGNWYYLLGNGKMATGASFVDMSLSDFGNDGKWKGYLLEPPMVTVNSNSNNISSNSIQTNTTESFTIEKAKKILEITNSDKSFYNEGYKYNIELTQGGYNGYPIEDKIYKLHDPISNTDSRYRMIGVIDKNTGEYYGVFRVFEIGYGEELPNYSSTTNLDTHMDISESTFDKKGDWNNKLLKAVQDEIDIKTSNVLQSTTDNKVDMDKMMNQQYRQAHQAEYDKLIQKSNN